MDTANFAVKGERCRVFPVSKYPRLEAAEGAGMVERRLHELFPDASTAPGGGNADLVDPEFVWLVGMPVVESRDKSDDAIIGDRRDEVMPRIAQEGVGQARIDFAIEHPSLHAFEANLGLHLRAHGQQGSCAYHPAAIAPACPAETELIKQVHHGRHVPAATVAL